MQYICNEIFNVNTQHESSVLTVHHFLPWTITFKATLNRIIRNLTSTIKHQQHCEKLVNTNFRYDADYC